MTEFGLDAKVAFLKRADAYPEPPERVVAIETHMSWVFLTERFAYKLKKPLRYDGLDFSTLGRRQHHCAEEVRLNRRLAKSVYLGTLALTEEPGGTLALDGAGRPIDWLVHMRRLPADQMLDARIERGLVRQHDVQEVADRLAVFYASAPPVLVSAAAFRERLERGVRNDLRELGRPEFGLPRRRLEEVAQGQLAFLEECAALFDERVHAGRIVEGHGDLRPEHICLAPEPVIIDCLEFSAELRELDPVDELAFLALECERLGQARVGGWFLEAYTQATGDAPNEALLRFYRNYRALRRAKLAVWHLVDPTVRDPGRFGARARRYLELAQAPKPRSRVAQAP